jgi:PAS domain S-box-containing protein
MSKAQILVVEDEAIVAKDIQNTLTKLGYQVPAIAVSGKSALEKVTEFQPDLVLMDIVLKGKMDGIETADRIRTNFDIPVIYLTAYDDDKTLGRAKVTEPFGYLIKPFQDRELHSTIEMALYKQKIDKKLKDNETWLATTLNSLGDGVIATNAKGLVTFINPIAEWMTGYKYKYVIGKPLEEVLRIIDEDSGKQIENITEKILKKDKVVKLAKNSLLKSKKGTTIPIMEMGTPIIDDNKELIGIVIVFQDITERRSTEEELQESEQRYRQLVELLPEPMVVYSNGILIYVNPSGVNLFKATSSAELLGKSIIDFTHPDNQEELTAYLHEMESGHAEKKTIRLTLIQLEGGKVNVEVTPIRIKYKRDPAIQLAFTDITKPRRIEETLRESEKKYRNLVERAADGIAIVQNGRVKFLNPRLEEITGYTNEEVIGTEFMQYLHPDELPKVAKRYKARMAGKKVTKYETIILHKDGYYFDVELDGGVIPYHGSPADLVYVRDITERKKVENALRDSEAKYRSLVEMSPDAITISDLNGRLLMVNKKALDLFGSENEDDLIGKIGIEYIVPEDRDRATNYVQQIIEKGAVKSIQYKFFKKDGSEFHGEVSSTLITDPEGNPKSLLSITRDITERIKFDQALRESEEKYSNLFHKSNDSIIIHDLEGKILDVNKKGLKLFGYKKSEFSSLNIQDLHPASMFDKSKLAFETIIKEGNITFDIEFLKKDGDRFSAEVSSSMFELGEKKVIQGIIRDITARKETEKSIRESEMQLRSILDSMSEAIHVVNRKLEITMINSAFLRWNKKLKLETDVIGKSIFEVFPFLPKKIKKEYQKVFKTGKSVTTEEQTKLADLDIITEVKKIPLFEKNEITQIVTVIRDITPQKP